MFWQGGFTFYAAVVVPVGQDVLGSHLAQGFITRQVTYFLNWAGAVCLLPLAWDIIALRDPSSGRSWRWFLWITMAAILGALFALHSRLDGMLDPLTRTIHNRDLFRPEHRAYLWLSTVQWLCSLIFSALSLKAWQSSDRETRGATAQKAEL
jgi:hypothetical protein